MFLTILKSKYLLTLVVLAGVVVGGTFFIIHLTNNSEIPDVPPLTGIPPIIKHRAGVVTNGLECASIGGNILRKGGSAVDAAIAALFCEGVAQPQSMGLGGGFLMTIYSKEKGTVETLISRETAPADASKDMFHGNSSLSQMGGLSVGVPGELRGYWEAHKKYGRLEWAELIYPTINLCRQGHKVTEYLVRSWKEKEKELLEEPELREIYIDPETNQVWKEGSYVKRLKLADTLEIIAKEGPEALYNGSLTKDFIDDIKRKGGIMTETDLHNYKPIWEKPIVAQLSDNMTLYTMPLPGSGVVLTFILNMLNEFLDRINYDSLTNWQRIVESFKFAYGRRTELGDPDFVTGIEELIANLTSPTYAEHVKNLIYDNMTFQDPTYYGANYSNPEDYGTAHISVIAPDGDAVAVTSTINLIFGAMFMSNSTGIILNDQMDDFSAPNITNAFGLPPSPANFIKPGKRPLSSMSPSIIVDRHGDVRLVVGAAGGSKITTSIALVIIKNLWYRESLKRSVDDKRLHHQLYPMAIQIEEDFEKSIVDGLHNIGHELLFLPPSSGFAAVTALSRQNGTIYGQWDIRRQGSVDIF